MNDKEITIYSALCFTCAYDGYCGKPMRYTKCKDYIERKELC